MLNRSLRLTIMITALVQKRAQGPNDIDPDQCAASIRSLESRPFDCSSLPLWSLLLVILSCYPRPAP